MITFQKKEKYNKQYVMENDTINKTYELSKYTIFAYDITQKLVTNLMTFEFFLHKF